MIEEQNTPKKMSKRERHLFVLKKRRPVLNNGQLYKFQILFKTAMPGLNGEQVYGPIQSIYVDGETPAEAEFLISKDGDVKIVSIGPGQPILDPARKIFDLQGAAAFLGMSPDQLQSRIDDGSLAKSKTGEMLFTEHRLLEFARAKEEKAA